VFQVLAELEDADSDPVHWDRWHELQEWLAVHGEYRTYIPYIGALGELFPNVATRLRRDFVSAVCLIRAHAVLHQVSRERDDRGRVVATIADYQAVRELVGGLIAEGADAGVSQAMRDTVETVRRLIDAQPATDYVSMKAITDALSVGRSAAYDRVTRALTRGYLLTVAGKDERTRKITLGAALPGEDLFLPSGEDLVRVASGPPSGRDSGSTIEPKHESSGSPACPDTFLDEEEIERLAELAREAESEAIYRTWALSTTAL
jgi:hypothetical protein